jgi:hypothetical protein
MRYTFPLLVGSATFRDCRTSNTTTWRKLEIEVKREIGRAFQRDPQFHEDCFGFLGRWAKSIQFSEAGSG